jgi:hypothetical protein
MLLKERFRTSCLCVIDVGVFSVNSGGAFEVEYIHRRMYIRCPGGVVSFNLWRHYTIYRYNNRSNCHSLDRKDQQLLLSVQYECSVRGIKIPWQEIGERIDNGITDNAILQHLSKLRQRMLECGFEVPPGLNRGGFASREGSKPNVWNGKPPDYTHQVNAGCGESSRSQKRRLKTAIETSENDNGAGCDEEKDAAKTTGKPTRIKNTKVIAYLVSDDKDLSDDEDLDDATENHPYGNASGYGSTTICRKSHARQCTDLQSQLTIGSFSVDDSAEDGHHAKRVKKDRDSTAIVLYDNNEAAKEGLMSSDSDESSSSIPKVTKSTVT